MNIPKAVLSSLLLGNCTPSYSPQREIETAALESVVEPEKKLTPVVSGSIIEGSLEEVIAEKKAETEKEAEKTYYNHDLALSEIIREYQEENPDVLKEQRKIVVDKKERRLTLYFGDAKLKEYRIALDFLTSFSIYDKLLEGDHQTPEGEFRLVYRFVGTFGKSFLISYPTNRHADLALKGGIIDQRTYNRIVQANDICQQPPQKTRMGGEILIHAGGSERDWTAGCVALDDKDMNEIYSFGKTGCTYDRKEKKFVPRTLLKINP